MCVRRVVDEVDGGDGVGEEVEDGEGDEVAVEAVSLVEGAEGLRYCLRFWLWVWGGFGGSVSGVVWLRGGERNLTSRAN